MADYSINAVTRKVSYTGSAGVGPYAFSFEILDETDVAVYKNADLLTLTTDYTVTINANGTGSITLVVAATADDTIVILGARDIERTTDFVTAGDLRASSLNEQLDSLTIFDQQIDERVERSIKAPAYDPTGIDMTLPGKEARASSFLSFDANGDLQTIGIADSSAPTSITKQNYIGDGTTTDFTLAGSPGSFGSNVSVYIDGVYQERDGYSVSGTTIAFTEAPPLNASIEVLSFRITDIGATNANAVTYDQGGSGYASRSVESKLQEFVSVKDFGAAGDGVTDDSDAFNNAIAAVGSGGTVYCEGSYKIDSTVTLSSGVSLVANFSAELTFGSAANFELSGANNVQNIIFNMNSTARQVLGVNVTNIKFKNCTAKNSTNNGFFFSVGCSNLIFEDCTATANTKSGFAITGNESNAPNRIQFINCRAFSNGQGGIAVSGTGEQTSPAQSANYATNILISGCITNSNGTTANSGIEFPYSRFVSVVNCVSFSNFEHGISCQETSDFIVSGCVCYQNGESGFNAQSGYDPYNKSERGVVSGCAFYNNNIGVSLKEQCANIVFSGNSMLDNDLYSFELVDLGSSGLKSNDIILVGNDMHPFDSSSFANRNDSTGISSPDQLNSRGQPLMINRAITEDIDSALTIDTTGSLNNWPEVFFITDTGTDVSRSLIAQAIKGRRITLMADGSGGVDIRHNQGDATYAGFVLSAAATVTLGAFESITFLGNGSNWIEIAKNT